MENLEFALGPVPQLILRDCAGDGQFLGWERPQVQMSADGRATTVQAQEDESLLQVSGVMPLAVRLPAQGQVSLQNCSGDTLVAAVQGLEQLQHCGDVVAHQVGSTRLEGVNGDVTVQWGRSLHVAMLVGDLAVQRLESDVTIAGVNGDVLVQGVGGQLEVQGVKGDVTIRDVAGGVMVSKITGELEFWGNPQQTHYTLECNGDLSLVLDPACNVSLELEAPLGDVECRLELAEIDRSEHRLTGKVGQGTAVLKATARRGSIEVRAKPVEDLHTKMQRDWAHAEARAARLEQRVQAVLEKARRKSERAVKKARVRASWQAQWPLPRGAPPNAPTHLEEERLAVLKMLSEGKINAEQAEVLLKAMEE